MDRDAVPSDPGPGGWGLSGQGHGTGWRMRTPCLQQGLDTTPGAVKVSGTLVPTSEVGRLCYPEMGPLPQVTPPQKEF